MDTQTSNLYRYSTSAEQSSLNHQVVAGSYMCTEYACWPDWIVLRGIVHFPCPHFLRNILMLSNTARHTLELHKLSKPSNYSVAIAVVTCNAILAPANGHLTCADPLGKFSFNSSCNVSCDEGYKLRGKATLTCLSAGNWSAPTPVCEGTWIYIWFLSVTSNYIHISITMWAL